MRVHGTLKKWNDDRGFGFVSRAQRDEDVFVHISAFPKDGIRPRVGELVSFEINATTDGKMRAVNIQRSTAPRRAATPVQANGSKNTFAALLALAAVGAIAFGFIARYSNEGVPSTSTGNPAPAWQTTTVERFRCDGRTRCTQMTSCAEATYFQQNCPNVKMDGDNDGIPCEQQWCSH